ncbi:MAG: hypothetical protein IPJ82_09890 [Lewinellaceae bacterium]|nr:hypothetical protein [Lewinellaceae bacterium]
MLQLGKGQLFSEKTGQEIDFILDEKKAIEVKETPGMFDLKRCNQGLPASASRIPC